MKYCLIDGKALSSVKSYFDSHSHSHAYHSDPKIYESVFTSIRNNKNTEDMRILDVGCGDGSFMIHARDAGIRGTFLGTDVSFGMLKTAQDGIRGLNIDLIACDAFNLPIKDKDNFDIIHLDSVLHHLIARTKTKSFNLCRKLLNRLCERVINGGMLIVEEVYYDSYIIPSFTSFVIFHGLKMLNFLHLDLKGIIRDIEPGLEVNFMQTMQLERLLNNLKGEVTILSRQSWHVPSLYRLCMLKELGHVALSYNKRH